MTATIRKRIPMAPGKIVWIDTGYADYKAIALAISTSIETNEFLKTHWLVVEDSLAAPQELMELAEVQEEKPAVDLVEFQRNKAYKGRKFPIAR
jgi:hypothetical protein